MFPFDWWVAVIVGVILGAFLTPIVAELLPVDLRFHLAYAKKRITKFVHSPQVRAGMIAKSPDITQQTLGAEDVLEKLRLAITSSGHEPRLLNGGIEFPFEVGGTPIEASLRLSVAPKGGKLVVTQLEAQVWGILNYRTFDKSILELTEALHVAEEYLRIFSLRPLEERSLECKLGSLYELTGLLAEYKVGHMSAALNSGYRFDLGPDTLTVHWQRVIDRNVLSFVQKLVTFYY